MPPFTRFIPTRPILKTFSPPIHFNQPCRGVSSSTRTPLVSLLLLEVAADAARASAVMSRPNSSGRTSGWTLTNNQQHMEQTQRKLCPVQDRKVLGGITSSMPGVGSTLFFYSFFLITFSFPLRGCSCALVSREQNFFVGCAPCYISTLPFPS